MWGDFCKTYSPNAEEDRELMKIFEELYELGVTFDRIHEVGVNINGSAYGKLIDDFVQEKPVYLEKYKY